LNATYHNNGARSLSEREHGSVLLRPFFEFPVRAEEKMSWGTSNEDETYKASGIVFPKSQCPGGPGGRPDGERNFVRIKASNVRDKQMNAIICG
jgi:hypothetical protein